MVFDRSFYDLILIATGPYIQFWNTQINKCLNSIKGHNGANIAALQFSRSGNLLISGGWDSLIKIWKIIRLETSIELSLQWSSSSQLFCEGATLENSIFSTENMVLLQEHGAKNISDNKPMTTLAASATPVITSQQSQVPSLPDTRHYRFFPLASTANQPQDNPSSIIHTNNKEINSNRLSQTPQVLLIPL